MLASKIEDFPIFGGSKRPSKFNLFVASIFYRFWLRLGLQHGAILGPRPLKIRKNGSQKSSGSSKKLRCSPSLLDLNTTLLLDLVYERFGIDFGGVRARFFEIFG